MKLRFDKSRIATPIAMTALLASGAHVAEKAHKLTANKDEIDHSSPNSLTPKVDPDADGSFNIKLSDTPEEGWTETHHKRFHALAVKEALGSLTPSEAVELDALTIRRRQEESPRTGEEVIHEFKQVRVTRELVKALRQFVNFYEATGSSARTS